MKAYAVYAVYYLYLIGSFLYIPGSIALYWTSIEALKYAAAFFIIASVLFLAGGIVDVCFGDSKPVCLVLYLIGGAAFTAGSILFWPTLPDGTSIAGYWCFRIGSVSYFTGSGLLIYYLKQPRKPHCIAATAQYMCGSCLFVTGGILSQANVTNSNAAFATIWVVGSLAFTGGAMLSLVNYYRKP